MKKIILVIIALLVVATTNFSIAVSTALAADSVTAEERYRGIVLEKPINNPEKGSVVAGKLYCKEGSGKWERQIVRYNGDNEFPSYSNPVWEYTLNIPLPKENCDASTNDTSPGYRTFPR